MKNVVSNDIKNNKASRTDSRKVKLGATLICIVLLSVLNSFATEPHKPLTLLKTQKTTTVNDLEKLKRFNSCEDKYQVFNNIGIIFSDNNLEEAEYNYNKALSLEPGNDYILYNLANVQLQQNKNVLAAQTYFNLLGNPKFDQDLINFYLGIANEKNGELNKALVYYKASQKFEAAFNASVILRHQDNMLAALKESKRAIELNAKSEKALYNYSALAFLNGDINTAINSLKKSIKLNPKDSKLKQLAFFYVANQNLNKARETFGELCDQEMNNSFYVDGLLGIGSIDLNEGKYFECIIAMKKILSIEPQNANGHITIAHAYINVRNYKKADIHYLNAYRLGLVTESLVGLGVSKFKQEQYGVAHSYYSQLPNYDNLSYDSYVIFGINEYHLGDLVKAQELTEKAILINNKRPEAYSFLAKIQFQLFDFCNAELNYKKAIKLSDNKEVYMVNLANCYVYNRNYKKGLQQFQNAIKESPSYSKAYSGMGMCLLKLDRILEALKAIEKAIETNPKDPYNYANKSYVLARLASESDEESNKENYLTEAMEQIILAKEMDDSYMKKHYDNNIGMLFMELNNYDSARVYLHKEINHVTLNNQGILLRREGELEKAETKFNKSIEANKIINPDVTYQEPLFNLEKLYTPINTKKRFRKKEEKVEWMTYWIFLSNDIIDLRTHQFDQAKYVPNYLNDLNFEFIYYAFMNKKKIKKELKNIERKNLKTPSLEKTSKSCPTF